MVIAGYESKLILRAVDTLAYRVGRVASTVLQTVAQLLDAWWLDEDGQGLVAEQFLDIHAAADIDVKNHIVAGGHTVLDFAAEGAVITSRIYLLVFHERSFGNQFLELLVREEMVVDTINFPLTGLAVGCRY